MWPFKNKNREANFKEKQQISMSIDGIIRKIDDEKRYINDEITLDSVENLKRKLVKMSDSAECSNYGKCIDILNFIKQSCSDLVPLLSVSSSSVDMQMEFIANLVKDYQRGDSIYLQKQFKELYNKRSNLLARLIEIDERIKEKNEYLQQVAKRALASKNNAVEYRRYMDQVQAIKADISELEMNKTNASDHLDFINIAVYKVIQDQTYSDSASITDSTSEIISNALNNTNRTAYRDLEKQKRLSEQVRKNQTFINDAISSSDTFSKVNRNIASTNEYSRSAQEERDAKTLGVSSNKGPTQAELDELDKIIHG